MSGAMTSGRQAIMVKTDLKRASELIGQTGPLYQAAAKMLDEFEKIRQPLEVIVGSNQNPNCGGDRKMSVEQWECLCNVENSLVKFAQDYSRGMTDLRRAPSKPFMDDAPPRGFSNDDIPF